MSLMKHKLSSGTLDAHPKVIASPVKQAYTNTYIHTSKAPPFLPQQQCCRLTRMCPVFWNKAYACTHIACHNPTIPQPNNTTSGGTMEGKNTLDHLQGHHLLGIA
jgi:hypothetical protein